MMGPAYLEWLAGEGDGQEAYVHLLQETHVSQQGASEYMCKCQKIGFKSFWTGARDTGNGGTH